MTESGARSRGSRLTGSWKLKLWRSRHRLGWRHGFESHALRSRLDKTLGEESLRKVEAMTMEAGI